MADLTAQRTLVKSTPELWSELSEVESLAKHLGELGEIRITKVEPETTVAWEGEQISGTVELEQSGWGTRVTFRATVPEPDLPPQSIPAPEPESVTQPRVEPEALTEPRPSAKPQPEPERQPEPKAARQHEPAAERGNFITRWLFRERRSARTTVAVEPTAATEPNPIEEPATTEFEAVASDPQPDPAELEAATAEPAPFEPESSEIERVQQVLDGTLEALGQAHHRPFSRG